MNRLFCDFCGIELLEKDPKASITVTTRTFKSGDIPDTNLSSSAADHVRSTRMDLCPPCANDWIEDTNKRIKK